MMVKVMIMRVITDYGMRIINKISDFKDMLVAVETLHIGCSS